MRFICTKLVNCCIEIKICVKILCMNYKSKIELYSFPKNFFSENCPVCHRGSVVIWTYENVVKKTHTFRQRSKNVKKRAKNRYCVNPL